MFYDDHELNELFFLTTDCTDFTDYFLNSPILQFLINRKTTDCTDYSFILQFSNS